MGSASVRLACVLTLALALGSMTGLLVAGQEQANGQGPPGVANGSLETPGALLEAHTSLLVETGFEANGTTNVTIIRQNVLVDVQRTANRTVAAGANEYVQSQRSVADATVASLIRGEYFWGNDSVEALRRIQNDETTFNVSERKPDNRLSGAATMWPYLASGNYTLNETTNLSDDGTGDATPTQTIGGEQRYTLVAVNLANATRIENRLPDGATNARNFSATVVVDEDGRVHRFNASVEYTIQGSTRTHTISFTVQELGVESVSQPDWVDKALARSTNESGQQGGEGSAGRQPSG